MKKLFALLLACIMLFLTACNQNPPSETTTGSSPNSSHDQENPNESELKDTIIRIAYMDFIETPSRILFEGKPETDTYTFYYSKADGKAYVYCFDPLCDHAGEKCLANPHELGSDGATLSDFLFWSTSFINNRFYTVTQHGQIYSFSFDGSDLKIEYGPESFKFEELSSIYYVWDPNIEVYEEYIYIRMDADENGNPHTLRFNTETKEMDDLTEKTGNAILTYFFYNEEVYGLDAKLRTWVKADLELKNMEPIEDQPTSDRFYGSVFFDCAYERIDSKTRKYLGIKAHDMKTGESTIFSNEMLGLEANQYTIVTVDENYVYFYQDKQILIGTYLDPKGKERKLYKSNEGKLYRVKHDGTECVCIYDNPEFEFCSSDAIICGDQFIILGRSAGIRDGSPQTWDRGMKVGTIGPDGKIDKFEPIELVY